MESMVNGGDVNAEEEMLKHHAKFAADDILNAEKHKKNKKLMKHVKKELKERAKHIDAAMGTPRKKSTPPKPAKKPASKKMYSSKKK